MGSYNSERSALKCVIKVASTAMLVTVGLSSSGSRPATGHRTATLIGLASTRPTGPLRFRGPCRRGLNGAFREASVDVSVTLGSLFAAKTGD